MQARARPKPSDADCRASLASVGVASPAAREATADDRMTRPEFAALTIELGTPRSSDRAMRQSSRVIAFPESDHRASDRGVIAIDGQRSRRSARARDPVARNAIVRPRAFGPRMSGHRVGDIAMAPLGLDPERDALSQEPSQCGPGAPGRPSESGCGGRVSCVRDGGR